MRLTIVLLGHTFDVSLEPTEADEDEPTPVNMGETGHTAVGFIACHEIPDEMPRLGAGQYDPEYE